jgi:hypothetical protein
MSGHQWPAGFLSLSQGWIRFLRLQTRTTKGATWASQKSLFFKEIACRRRIPAVRTNPDDIALTENLRCGV